MPWLHDHSLAANTIHSWRTRVNTVPSRRHFWGAMLFCPTTMPAMAAFVWSRDRTNRTSKCPGEWSTANDSKSTSSSRRPRQATSFCSRREPSTVPSLGLPTISVEHACIGFHRPPMSMDGHILGTKAGVGPLESTKIFVRQKRRFWNHRLPIAWIDPISNQTVLSK